MNSPVVVSLADLQSGEADKFLPEAFGPESLGIIIVKDISEKFVELRRHALTYSSQLAQLGPDILSHLESPESNYLVGWSCGKEQLADGTPDNLKGSYYTNCSFYVDPTLDNAPMDDSYDFETVRGYVEANHWPPEEALPGFKDCLKEICTLVIDTAAVVARACDRYLKKEIADYNDGYLEHIVKTSTTTKARLLHYFPTSEADSTDTWCGEHLDHGCLTGLTSAMFIDEAKGLESELDACPDAKAGLYIRNRAGDIVQVQIPRDCLAFQTGQALQVVTQNQFKAVSHFVRGSDVPGIARNTLAVFCQPSLHEDVGGDVFANFSKAIVDKNTIH
ncbi:hypothetical protein V1511DRAFT_498506 [Dipodascopsis uninucleata]